MHPILFHLGSFGVHTYGVMGALGFLAASYVILRRSRAMYLNRDRVVDIIFWTSLAAVVGARAVFVFQDWGRLHGPMDWVNIRQGGLVFYGALLFGLPVAAWLIKRYSIPFYAFMDIVATALPLGHGFARIGCFTAGCCYGRTTSLPWAVTFTDPGSAAPLDVPLHPVQLYEAAGLFALAGLCAWVYARKRFDGQVMLTYLLGYAVLRTITKAFRGDARGWFLEPLLGHTLSTSQGLSILVAIAALGVFLWDARRARTAAREG